MRFTGPVHFKVSPEGKKYIGEARTLLGIVEQRILLSNGVLTQLTLNKTLPDGTVINVQVIGKNRIVHIFTLGEDKEIEDCKAPLSGYMRDLVPQWFYHKYDKQWWKEDINERMPLWSDTAYGPSEFTGMMVNVAQVLMGLPNGTSVLNGYYIHPLWAQTHGIFIQKNNDVHVPWIISISAAGVYTKKMPYCRGELCKSTDEGSEEDDAEAFANRNGFLPQMFSGDFFTAQGWIELLSAGDIEPFYKNKYPLFPKCGWAFNSNGSRANNTALEYVVDGSKWGTKNIHCQITISTDIEGAPSSAQFNLLDERFIIQDHLWSTLWLPISNELVTPYGFSSPTNVDDRIGVAGDRIPIYVYYETNDSLRVVTFVNPTDDGGNTVRDDVFVSYSSGGVLGTTGYSVNCGYQSGWNGSRRVTTTASTYPEDVTPKNNYSHSGTRRELINTPFNVPYKRKNYIAQGYMEISKADFTSATEGENYHTTVIIPAGTRNAFYYYEYRNQSRDETISSYYRGTSHHPASYKQYRYYDSVNHWTEICTSSGGVEYVTPGCIASPDGLYVTSFADTVGTFTTCVWLSVPNPAASGMYKIQQYDPVTFTFKCFNNANESTGTGWCFDWVEEDISWAESGNPGATSTYNHHSETLKVFLPDGEEKILYSNEEEYDPTECGEIVKCPDWGNKFIVHLAHPPSPATVQLYYDRNTDLIIYTNDLYRITDEHSFEGNYSGYPLNTITNITKTRWIGFPGTNIKGEC